MNKKITPEKMQEVIDAVRQAIPLATWTVIDPPKGPDVRGLPGRPEPEPLAWLGRVGDFHFTIVEWPTGDPVIPYGCDGTVGLVQQRMMVRLTPELAKLAVKAAKG